MTGRRGFSDLAAKLSHERQARIGRLAKKMRRDMNLAQSREARSLSQAALGETPHVEQPAIEAMGGELETVAKFPDRDVRIRNFRDLGKRDQA